MQFSVHWHGPEYCEVSLVSDTSLQHAHALALKHMLNTAFMSSVVLNQNTLCHYLPSHLNLQLKGLTLIQLPRSSFTLEIQFLK